MKNKVFSVVLSVVVAFGLWLYVITVVSPGSENTYYNIPVVLQNENVLKDRGLMITSELPAVTLTLSGTRTDLNKLDENNINILVNAAAIEAAGNHQLNYTVLYPGSVSSNAITRKWQSTNVITVKVENRITKNVEVVVDYMDTTVPVGFVADKENVIMDVKTIEVSGPESVVDKITQARIQVDLTNRNMSVVGRFAYQLCDAANKPVESELITTNVETVDLTVKIQRLKEIPLKLNAIYGGGVTDKNCSIVIEPQTIRVSGSEALLENLNELILDTVNLAELLENQTLSIPIVLPEGVQNETGVEEATVTITFKDLKAKKLNVTNIQAINVPEDMVADIYTQQLSVTVRGPSSLISRITAEDVTITVDFAGVQPGEGILRGVASFKSQYSSVGVVGIIEVTANLQEAVLAQVA
ncbi:MAG: hypothetical protein IJO04_03620 [Oscillospiraceae bacterium]|nr:hypothetical protein [Oscillospiraceae bacterium]